MRYIVFILFLLIGFSSFGQGLSWFGAQRPQDTSKTKGVLKAPQMYLTNLPAADINDAFLMMHADGTVGYGNDGTFYKFRSDTTGSDGYGTRRWVDSLVSATSGTTIDSAYFASKHYADSINALNTLQAVTDRDSTSTHKVTVAKLLVNGNIDTGTPDGGILVNRTLTGGSSAHSFRAFDDFSRSGLTLGVNAYDAKTNVTSAQLDHIADFQSRSVANLSDSLTHFYGLYTEDVIKGTTKAANHYSVYANRAILQNTATLVNDYGLYVTSMTGATNNYAVYTAGTTQSYFGGNISTGSDLKFNHNSYNGTLTTTTLTGDRTYTLQNASGTIAFTSDITSTDTTSLSNRINAKVAYSDTTSLIPTQSYLSTNYLRNGTAAQLNAKLLLGASVLDTFPYLTINKALDQPTWVATGTSKNTLDIWGTTTGNYLRIGYAGSTNNGNLLEFYRALGTNTSPTVITNNSHLAWIDVNGYDGTANREVGWLYWRASENWSSTARGNKIDLMHVINGTTTQRSALIVQGTGVIALNPTAVAQPVVISGFVSLGTGAALEVNGNIWTNGKITLGSGANKCTDIVKLVNGTLTVNNTNVTINSRIFVQYDIVSGTIGNALAVPAASYVVGTSFVINSVNSTGAVVTTDQSTVRYWILN